MKLSSFFAFTMLLVPVYAASGQACPKYDPAKVMQYAHTPDPSLVIVGAHRGYWEYVPENTPEAVNAAIQKCIEMSEIDVRLTSDGVPAMIHDWYIQRTSTGTGLIYAIPNSIWLNLYLRDRFGNPTTIHPPTLEKILATIAASNEVLVLDCKDAQSVGRVPDGVTLPNSFQVLTATYQAIVRYQQQHPEAGMLLDRIIFKIRYPELPVNPVDALHALGINNCDTDPSSACTHLNLVAIWYATDYDQIAGKPKFPNFVATVANYSKLLEPGVTNFFWFPEAVVKYPRDLLRPQVLSGLRDGFGLTAFAATADWAEGTSMGSGQCCSNRDYNNPADTSSNYTGDFEYLVGLQHFNWITSDKSIEAIQYLTALKRRNTSLITAN